MCRWDDLVVGAPEFFVKDGLVGGAAYIYINNQGKNWEKTVPTQLLGQEESMFGLAVENIGDVNQDGYGGWSIYNIKYNMQSEILQDSDNIMQQ